MAAVLLPLARRPGDRVARAGADRGRRDPADRLSLRGRQDRDGALFGGRAVVAAELLLEHARQLAAGGQLLDDVGAAEQLAVHEDLRNRWPTGYGRQLV